LAAQFNLNVGIELSQVRPAEALEHLERSRDLMQKVVQDQPTHADFQDLRRKIHAGLEMVKSTLALRELAREVAPDKPAESRQALQKALDQGNRLPQRQPGTLYFLAGVHAQLSRFAGLGSPVPPAVDAQRRQHADKAVDYFRQAVAAGWTNLEETKQDPLLNPIREREDFKKLMTEIEAKEKGQSK
jgi:hypothetical protein